MLEQKLKEQLSQMDKYEILERIKDANWGIAGWKFIKKLCEAKLKELEQENG